MVVNSYGVLLHNTTQKKGTVNEIETQSGNPP